MLVHGWAADSRIWDSVIGAHGLDIALWAPDLPGHGRSPLHLDGKQLDAYHSVSVDELCSWGEEHDLVEAPIAAWAWGTWVVADAIATGRLRPRSVMLMALAPSADVPAPYGGPLARDWPRYTRMIVRTMVASVLSPERETWLARIMRDTSPAAAGGVHLAAWSPPGPELVLPPDSVVVLGDRDRIQPGDEGVRLADTWGGARVERVSGAGHTVFVEARAEFDRIWRHWLTRLEVLS